MKKKISECAAATPTDLGKPGDRPIVIEKNIPLPSVGRARITALANAIKSMKIGDSFELPVETNRERVRVYTLGRSYGVRLASRKTEKGYRFWSVAQPVS